jgi:phage terminase large subunit
MTSLQTRLTEDFSSSPAIIAARAAAEIQRIEAETLRRRLLDGDDIPPVFQSFLNPSRYKGAFGGRGGCKSHVFGRLLLRRCLQKLTRAVCVREFQISLEQSVKRLLEDLILLYGLTKSFRILDTHIETPFGGIIIFQGMNNHTADSIKSLEGYDVAWVEEAQNFKERSLKLLRPTIRMPDSELWFSWNPKNADDPVDVLLRKNTPKNAIIVESSYKDNPWFPDVLRQDMEQDRERDPDLYDHVWLGGYEKHSIARVFKNWRVEEFELPSDASFMLGSDWGFSADPSTLVRASEQTIDTATGRPWPRKRLYVDRELYAVGVEIDHLPAFFDGLACGCKLQEDGTHVPGSCENPRLHGWARNWEIVADSARPETISYLNRNGYPRMIAAQKGKDSVKEGVIFLQGYDIIIHPRCTATIDEFTTYSYKQDPKTEVVIPILEDKKNHIIDPMRYAIEKTRKASDWVTW